MTSSNNSRAFLQGVPELLVLRILATREMYGYELVRSIEQQTKNEMSFGEGVIYPLLHSLQKRRLLAIRREKLNGRERIYYRLSKSGHKLLEEKISHWQRVTRAIQMVLDGGPDAAPTN